MKAKPTGAHPGRGPSPQRQRAQLAERLHGRREEIEQAILTRVYSLEDPVETGDPAYVEGLRVAVGQAISYALEGIVRSEARPAPIPTPLFAQARHAARDGVSLDTVLRRYFAGYSLLGDYVHREAEETGLLGAEAFRRLRRDQAALLDRLLAAVAEEYGREEASRTRSSAQHRAEVIKRLLAGELLDTAELGYELSAWHVGIVTAGAGAEETIRELARGLECRLMVVPAEGEVWGWLGARSAIETEKLADLATREPGEGARMALGEPGQGVEGWRFTHRQAMAVWPLSGKGKESVVRYADNALLAAVLRDELLMQTLHRLYLRPLLGERDGGASARHTLRAYLDTGCNVSSAAFLLGVNRNTVASRLRAIEVMVGQPLHSNTANLDVALRVAELQATSLFSGL